MTAPDPRGRTPRLGLPYILAPGELRELLNLKWSRFCELQKRGHYDHLLLESLDRVRRYSGPLIEAWLLRERVDPPRLLRRPRPRRPVALRPTGTA